MRLQVQNNKEYIKELENYIEILEHEEDRLREKLLNKGKEKERLNKQIEEYQKALDETISEKIDLEKENNLLKQIVGNDKKYSYGIRMGSDKRVNDYQYINENGSPRDYYEIVNENGELCKEIERLKSQLQQKENTIKKIENDINNIKDIIKKQPSDDPDTDNWIQIRLNGLLYVINEGE